MDQNHFAPINLEVTSYFSLPCPTTHSSLSENELFEGVGLSKVSKNVSISLCFNSSTIVSILILGLK
ncbi:hypothetical protein BpHYR1_050646 [Brachionus plicatilis]|uniref:Uncharacterized protein n=1 Tax=Brachionus plicatilis TaxID=10195 RepID=A0A3M7QLZ2_BRAPC|nr:hypothetical protein BpHYR1_050646 [Brachionus plicatilis]